MAGKLAEYRFDDPMGEVGVETILWRTDDGSLVADPAHLPRRSRKQRRIWIGISAHSVLGRRWVYDGCGDHVWAATLAEAIGTGGIQTQMFFEQDGERIDVPPRMRVTGSGSLGDPPAVTSIDSLTDDGRVTVVRAGDIELTLAV